MSAFLVTVQSLVQCSHVGTATPVAPNSRVLVDNAPTVSVPSTTYLIAGCSLTNTVGKPFCQTGTWTSGTQRVTSNGLPLAISSGSSTCVSTGEPLRAQTTQQRVSAQ